MAATLTQTTPDGNDDDVDDDGGDWEKTIIYLHTHSLDFNSSVIILQ